MAVEAYLSKSRPVHPSLVSTTTLRWAETSPCHFVASIIIVCYNGSAYLDDCLSSVIDDVGDTAEIIVIDNHSTDDSVRMIREQFAQVRLIENQENLGFVTACNQGAQAAIAGCLVFLNQDTRVCPGWLTGLLSALDDDPGIGLTTSLLLLMSAPDQINACGQDVHFSGLVFLRGFLQDRAASLAKARQQVNAVSGASFAIRRDLWQMLGGFDETLFMYYEETDLSWRAQLAGFSSVYVPESVVYHDYRPARPSESSLIYSKRNRYILLLKNWRWATILLLLPGLLLSELVDWGHAVLTGRHGIRAKWLAYRSLVTLWPTVMKTRQDVQRDRRRGDVIILQSLAVRLSPVEFSGGRAGTMATAILNRLMSINRAFALALCQLLKC